MFLRIRYWLIRLLAGELSVAVNISVNGPFVLDRPGLVAGVTIKPERDPAFTVPGLTHFDVSFP